jgi:hypothetical protein
MVIQLVDLFPEDDRFTKKLCHPSLGPGLSHPISMYECSTCSLPICEQLVLKVNEKYFHGACLNCSECQMKLAEKCFARDGNVYCKEDFFK